MVGSKNLRFMRVVEDERTVVYEMILSTTGEAVRVDSSHLARNKHGITDVAEDFFLLLEVLKELKKDGEGNRLNPRYSNASRAHERLVLSSKELDQPEELILLQ